jgi:signal transduction histidine kinase
MKANNPFLSIITLAILVAITGLTSTVNANAIVLQDNLAAKSELSDLAQIDYYRNELQALLPNSGNVSSIQSAKKLYVLWQTLTSLYQNRYKETFDKLSVIEGEMLQQANTQIDNKLSADLKDQFDELKKNKEILVKLHKEMLPLYTAVAKQLCQNLLIFEAIAVINYIENSPSDGFPTADLLSSVKNDVIAFIKEFSHDIRTPCNNLQGLTSVVPSLEDSFFEVERIRAQGLELRAMQLSELLKDIGLDNLIKEINAGRLTEVDARKEAIIAVINSVALIYVEVTDFLTLARANKNAFELSVEAQEQRVEILTHIEKALSLLLAITRKGFEPTIEETNIALPELKPYVDFNLFFPSKDLGVYVLSQSKRLSKFNTHVKINTGIPMANISESSLDIILQNIINNALKYGGKSLNAIDVKVDYAQGFDTIILEVSNDGERIDADKVAYDPETGRQRLFDPKVTGGYVDNNDIRSHGIGLDTVWKLITEVQGSVSAENTDTNVKIIIKLRPYREPSDPIISEAHTLSAA